MVAGGDPVELKGDGIFLSHDDRYAVTAEFLEVWKRLLAGELLDFKGKHLSVEGGKVFYPPVQQPYPPLFFGGSSDAGNAVAADHADVYLTWASRRPTLRGRSPPSRRWRHRAAVSCGSASACT